MRIENLTTLTGGASRTTSAFDAVADDTRHTLILRTGPPDEVHAGMELEAGVQQRAAAAGVPVPHILAADNSAALDRLGFSDETQLAAAIRAGELDNRAGEVLPVLRTLVRHRLTIAHPGYDEAT